MHKHQVHWKAEKLTLIYSTLYLQKKKTKISHKKVTTYTQVKAAYGKHIPHCQQECWITLWTSLSCFLIKASRLMPCLRALVNVCNCHNKGSSNCPHPICNKDYEAILHKPVMDLQTQNTPAPQFTTVAYFEINTLREEFQKLSFYVALLMLFCIWNWSGVFNIKVKQGKKLLILLQTVFSFNLFDKVFHRLLEYITTELASCKINCPIWFSSIRTPGRCTVMLESWW